MKEHKLKCGEQLQSFYRRFYELEEKLSQLSCWNAWIFPVKAIW